MNQTDKKIKIKQEMLKIIKSQPDNRILSSELKKHFSFSKTYCTRLLNELYKEGKLLRKPNIGGNMNIVMVEIA